MCSSDLLYVPELSQVGLELPALSILIYITSPGSHKPVIVGLRLILSGGKTIVIKETASIIPLLTIGVPLAILALAEYCPSGISTVVVKLKVWLPPQDKLFIVSEVGEITTFITEFLGQVPVIKGFLANPTAGTRIERVASGAIIVPDLV